LDGVVLVLVELEVGADVVDLAVHAHAHVAGLTHVLEDAQVLALAVLDERREDHQARAGREGQDRVHDLLDGLLLDRPAAVRAVGPADAGVEQPQVIIDFGDGADRGAGVVRGALLVDGDRRRQAGDVVHVRLVHLAEELARVGGQRLDVAALALGVDRVKGERRLPRAGEARDDDELVAGNDDVDVLQVVLPGALHEDRVISHQLSVVSKIWPAYARGRPQPEQAGSVSLETDGPRLLVGGGGPTTSYAMLRRSARILSRSSAAFSNSRSLAARFISASRSLISRSTSSRERMTATGLTS